MGPGFRQGGWDGISRGSGIASWAPACSLWPAIAETASRSSRTTREIEMFNPFIAHSGEAEGARVHEKGRPRHFNYYPSVRRCAKDIDGVGSLRGFD